MRLFRKKDEQLFRLFHESARIAVRCGGILHKLIDGYSELDQQKVRITTMKQEYEQITRELMNSLNTSIILPLDREDACQLVQKMGKVPEDISGIIELMILYEIKQPDDRINKMVLILCESIAVAEKTFNMLDRIAVNQENIIACCRKSINLDKKQDRLYRSSTAELYHQYKANPLDINKYQEIYKQFKLAQGHLRDLAEFTMNISIKYS